jgi:ferredoxin
VWSVTVDADLCQGHAMCEVEAPDVFSVPKAGPAEVIGEVTAANFPQVQSAIRFCPTQALTLKERS